MPAKTKRTLLDRILDALQAIGNMLRPNTPVPERIPVQGKQKKR